MRTLLMWAVCLLFAMNTSFSQGVILEGYVFEEGNRGYLRLANVTILDKATKSVVLKTATSMEGVFKVNIPEGSEFIVRAEKDLFVAQEKIVSTIGKSSGEKAFVKFQMKRKPGYIFDVTIAEKSVEGMPADAVQGARIDVFNNTSEKEVMVLENHPHPTFKTHFEDGNHYTVLIRKKGFFNKRLEAFVNVKGCILCFEGVGNVKPSDVLTEGHNMGTLLANVELQPIEVGKGIKVDNIYYDLAKYNIRSDAATELDKLIVVLKNNPSLIVELGSHTDSRGRDSYNQSLSQKRAKAAVEYIVENGGIEPHRIQAKGYGETQILNKCKNDVKCRESQHQINRRTELKIVGFLSNDPFQNKSLAEIIMEEKFEKMLAEVGNTGEYKVPESGELPPDLKSQLERQNTPTTTTPPATYTQPSQPIVTYTPPVNTTPAPTTTYTPPTTTYTPPSTTYTPPPTTYTPPTTPTVATTPTRSTRKPFKPQTEVEVDPTDFTTQPEGFDDSMTADISRGNGSKIISERPISSSSLRPKVLKLPRDYSGYRIEFFNAPYELPSSHAIFSKHGNITMEQKKDGTYAYLMGDFLDWRDANKFLTNILLSRYPDARVVRYKKGGRLGQ